MCKRLLPGIIYNNHITFNTHSYCCMPKNHCVQNGSLSLLDAQLNTNIC